MLTLQIVAAGLLLLGTGLVIRMVMALDAPAFRPARVYRLPASLTVTKRHRTEPAERRAA